MVVIGTDTNSKDLARHLRKWEALKKHAANQGFTVSFNSYDRFVVRSIDCPENSAEHLATIEEVYAWIHGYFLGARSC